MAKISVNISKYHLTGLLKTDKAARGKSAKTRRRSKTSSFAAGVNLGNIKKHISPFLLFDWEFFSNELEFE
ncbi:MAG TPA: hypothetical protein VHB48_14960 [Chitinophagaceae bacterium]|nr:hypothetical protein [Chitinophagaceae bacterium]